MLTADGCQDVLQLSNNYCCPPPLCGNDMCCTIVAFLNLLPSGPIWTYWKEKAISYFESNDDPAECPMLQDPSCPSIVLHAVYSAFKLQRIVHGALWPALRESNPYTAVTTLDDYLTRLRWEDCYKQHCRSVTSSGITPYEVMGPCGPVFCDPPIPEELLCAVKRNVAIALTRLQRGIIRNLCGINWVIEPLKAELRPWLPYQLPPEPDPENYCTSMCPTGVKFRVYPTSDWLDGCYAGDVCKTLEPLPQVQAYWDWGCDRPAGTVEQIWPGILAAECIVRSILPPTCPTNIVGYC